MSGSLRVRGARGRTLRAVAAGIVCALLAGSGVASGGRDVVAEGPHYHLVSSGKQAEADDWLKMLEAAWPQFESFFGAAPKLAPGQRLSVAFFETRDDMEAAIRRGGGSAPDDIGGYYDPVSKTAYAFRQPSVWYTRTLLLHECGHQFHRLSRVASNVAPPAWYGEGVVEHLSHHTWDGERLRLGVVPMLSLEDRPGAALDSVKRGAFKPLDLVDGTLPADRPECMHLVRYLCEGEGGKLRKRFDELARDMDRGEKLTANQFTRSFGSSGRFLVGFADWLRGVQQPWEPIYVDWDVRGERALRGSAPVIALCRRRAETRRVTARVHRPRGGSWRGGVLLRWTGPEDYAIGMIDNARRAQIDRRKDGAWQRVAEIEVPAAQDDTWVVEAVRDGGAVSFVVGGATIGEIDAPPGSMGLAVDAATVDFTEIDAR